MLTNWAGNVTFGAKRVHRPSSIAELQRVVAGSERVRALGTGHSFNRIADSPGDLVSVAELPRRIQIDADRSTVTVSAGTRYGELAERLHQAGFALRNLASLPHISVAGACATGTHGSGNRNGNLATAVSAMDMVTADGERITVDRATDRFDGMVVALGALGVVTALTLEVVPAFGVRQYVFEHLPRERFGEHLFASAYSVSVFTDWTDPYTFDQVWLKCLDTGTAAPPRLDATPADGPRHPIAGMPAANCTEQLGVPGPWHERLPHFRARFTPSSGEELQSEYFVPRQLAAEAVDAVTGIRDRVANAVQISELRTVAADELWLSPAYRRDSLAVHFTWVKDASVVLPVIDAVEERLAPLGARPHWGKLFHTQPEVERLPDFRGLLRDYDPGGKFRPLWPALAW
jgi:alditol oxidase